jgi:hypothetical protein
LPRLQLRVPGDDPAHRKYDHWSSGEVEPDALDGVAKLRENRRRVVSLGDGGGRMPQEPIPRCFLDAGLR